MLTNCRVVLVRPHYAGNVGAVARAMANFGPRELVVVDPVADLLSHEARMLATNGVDILDAARVVATFDDAVADCGMVVATAGEIDGTRRETIRGTPAEVFPPFLAALASGPAALVFGPEPHGLTTDEIGRCHALLHLPTDPAYTSLNLSLAAGIALYELRNLAHGVEPLRREPAAFADFDRACQHLHRALTDVRFLFGQNADQLMHAFRHLIARSQPTAQEVKMLHGLAQQIEYVAGKLPPRQS
jgi:tRNA/rRNA methyltransferase